MAEYRGRFAPSPTGPLHLGSMVAAIGSWLDARAAGGHWAVRIEDLDPPREVPGAADAILRTLERFSLTWDGRVTHQSERGERYREILDELTAGGRAFGCDCTRSMLQGHTVYPGTCRGRLTGRSHRLAVGAGVLRWEDRWQGEQRFDLASEIGDFVLRRADGFWAYHLSVVVDDQDAGVTDVVRGVDLLDSTPRHLALYKAMGWKPPQYMHLPIVVNPLGQKLSKQTHAPAVDSSSVCTVFEAVYAHLGLPTSGLTDQPEGNLALGLAAWPERLAGLPT